VITRGTIGEFETVIVNTDSLELVLIPSLGAKVSSLRDLRNGREWLWKNPRRAYASAPHGSSYIQVADTGGWDECFPSVMECNYPSPPWEGAFIQDHGELWTQAPELEVVEAEDGVALTTRWKGVELPYSFERTILLASGSERMQFEYRVTNDGDSPIQWIWSAHPILAIEPGMELLVPEDARFNLMGALPSQLVTQKTGLEFPLVLNGVPVSPLPEMPGYAVKIWSDPLTEGWASLIAADGELRMRWDTKLLPQLGIWLNLGGWAGDGGAPYYNLGLEPCIGAQDSLADAVTQFHLFETLNPGEERNWWVEVELAALPAES
jgi:galactose mutarotase-like enzyme